MKAISSEDEGDAMDRDDVFGQAVKTAAEMDAAAGRWQAEAEAKQRALAELEERVGAEALADPDVAGKLAEALALARAELDVAESARTAAVGRATEARRQVLRAEAARLRAQAEQVRAEVTDRQRRTDELLGELEEHEAVRYAPAVVPSAIGVGSGVTPLTRTQQLVAEAAGLDHQAEEWEARAQADPGTVTDWVQRLLARQDDQAAQAA